MSRTILLLLIFLLIPCKAISQRIIHRSDDIRPRWVNSPGDIKRTNTSYSICLVEDYGQVLELLKNSSLLALSRTLEQNNSISGVTNRDVNVRNVDGNISSESAISLSFKTDTRVVDFTCKEIASYWEQFSTKQYRYCTLYAVSEPGVEPVFDNFEITSRYGIHGLWRSMIVPGWGQLYKGSIAKGSAIMVGAAASVGGIILCESTRTSYIKKMHEQPRYAKEYNSMSDSWKTGRNMCIGVAAILYVYNIIDAVATRGAKRVVVKKGRATVHTAPYMDAHSMGMGASIRF